MAMRLAAAQRLLSGRHLFTSFPFATPPSHAQAKPSTLLFLTGLLTEDSRAFETDGRTVHYAEHSVVGIRLSNLITTEGLRESFSKFGQVMCEEAAKGIEGMDGKYLDGSAIFAEYARPPPPPLMQSQP
ncbi:hypothetical protein Sjap_025365 [Stephania japonica]|uniref:RRM domain-containing protein n=1 Tax=Stephania japonica TaxID=461633 RepID=A0AAP0E9F5_9MAGN